MAEETKNTDEFSAFDVVQSAQVLEFGEYTDEDLEFDGDLDVLDSVLEADKFLFVFRKGDKVAKLHCRRLASAEIGMIESTLISPRVLTELAKDNDLADEDVVEIANNMLDGTLEKMCKAVEMSILNKNKPGLDRIRGWDASIIDKIYNKIVPKRGAETSVDRFLEVDSSSEE